MSNDVLELYSVFVVDGNMYGIVGSAVQSFFILENVTQLPEMAYYYRGVSKYRDEIIPILDLRKLFGADSLTDEAHELTSMMKQRKEDHLHWIEELCNSVCNKTDFKLATDPHKCAFGKWLDSYQTDDIGMRQYLNQFKQPHAAIHSIAERALALGYEDELEAAEALINHTRANEMEKMITLFDSFQKAYSESRREIVIVITNGERTIGLIADKVTSLEPLQTEDSNFEASITNRIGRRQSGDDVVLLVDLSRIFE